MPVIKNREYPPPVGFSNPHLQTMYPTLFRRVRGVRYHRQRIDTADGDFLDLDWVRRGGPRLCILASGLEGCSGSHYMLGLARAVSARGVDALAWNFRGCGGEVNRKLGFYHSGQTEDLHTVVLHALAQGYSRLDLVGFSLGGNLVLKYLGENESRLPAEIERACALSCPVDLGAASRQLARPENYLYMRRFLVMMHRKIRKKMAGFPDRLNDRGFWKIRTFEDYDNRYTAPHFGYADAREYWDRNSSRQFLGGIRRSTLLLSAQDDPFLGPECYPVQEASENHNLILEMPAKGGHLGFVEFNREGLYWSERRILEFLDIRGSESRDDSPPK